MPSRPPNDDAVRGGFTLAADWVVPGDGPPQAGGAVRVGGDGRIDAVLADAPADAVRLPSAAILPGFVNAHAHLEFSDLSEPLPTGGGFADWVRATVADRRGRTRGPMDAVRAGLAESLSHGVTTVGEIATDGWDAAALPADRPRLVVYRELLGLDPDRVGELVRTADAFLDSLADAPPGPPVTGGLSPHAPYSVHPRLLAAAVDLAARRGVPLAMHLTETGEEAELLADGTGPLADLLRGFGVWRDGLFGGRDGAAEFQQLCADAVGGPVLAVHGNFFADAACDAVAGDPRLTQVYCPRTHAAFGHPPHPWRRVIDAGGRVAVGTDGRGSNPDLSVRHELRFLRGRFPGVPPADLLHAGTLSAAEALGLGGEVGSLTPGKAADLAVLKLPRTGGDAWADLFDPGVTHAATFVGGRCLWGGLSNLCP